MTTSAASDVQRPVLLVGAALFVTLSVGVGAALAWGEKSQAERLQAAQRQLEGAPAPGGFSAISSCESGHRCFVIAQPRDAALAEVAGWFADLGYARVTRLCAEPAPSTQPCVVQGVRRDIKLVALSLPVAAGTGATKMDVSVFAGTHPR